MALPNPIEQLAAVEQLHSNPKYHDVQFLCRDGRISSNRAYLAARCEYFDRLLYGSMREGSASEISMPQSSTAALGRILEYLYSGRIPTDETNIQNLLEICSLAQCYMLSNVVALIADSLSQELQPQDLGPALSYALEHNLDCVVKMIWLAAPRLVTRPLSFDGGFSPEAICFCLEQACCTDALTGGPLGALAASACCSETEALTAVLEWMAQERGSCTSCCQGGQQGPVPAAAAAAGGSATNTANAAAGGGCGSSGASSSTCEQVGAAEDPCTSAAAESSALLSSGPAGSNKAPGSSSSSSTGEAQRGPLFTTPDQAGPPPAAARLTPEAAAAPPPPPEEPAEQGTAARHYSCEQHQQLLQSLLVRLNWSHLDPSTLAQLETTQWLSPAALLEVYKAHHRCSHQALRGSIFLQPGSSFGSSSSSSRGPSCSRSSNSGIGGGAGGGLLCDSLVSSIRPDGEVLLECRGQSHVSATAAVPFTSGRHSWQVLVHSGCDLVWVGVSDGTLDPRAWGGRQPGGWFYGSNDALCNNASVDNHAYQRCCGHGKWEEPAVVTLYLDMDARELWIALDGSLPKLGFTDLPPRVFPSVSIRLPAVLGFRFRPSSCWGWQQQQQEGLGAAAGLPERAGSLGAPVSPLGPGAFVGGGMGAIGPWAALGQQQQQQQPPLSSRPSSGGGGGTAGSGSSSSTSGSSRGAAEVAQQVPVLGDGGEGSGSIAQPTEGAGGSGRLASPGLEGGGYGSGLQGAQS